MSLNNLQVFGLIPARGRSKGIKNKNMLSVKGKALIDYTIEASINSKFIDKTFLSSDSDEILNYGKQKNISVIKRPYKYANDDASAQQVVSHFYNFLTEEGNISLEEDFYLSYLQPTSPLRTTKILDESFKLLDGFPDDSVISLVENKHTPYKSFRLDENGLVQSLFDESLSNQNRQSLQKTYRVNGAIYTFLISKFISNKGFPSNSSKPFIMKLSESLDIDSYEDLDALKLKLP